MTHIGQYYTLIGEIFMVSLVTTDRMNSPVECIVQSRVKNFLYACVCKEKFKRLLTHNQKESIIVHRRTKECYLGAIPVDLLYENVGDIGGD